MPSSSPLLKIRKIRVSKEIGLALDVESFTPGINIVRGDNSTGKSTLLKLIEFALGTARLKRSMLIPEIRRCERVVLEVELGNQIYTFERRFERSSTIEVYQGEIESFPRPYPSIFIAGQDISNFILTRLGIPNVSVIDEMSSSERAITFDAIFNMIYLDQEMGYSRIHARLSQIQRQSIFKLLTGISVPELFALTLERESVRKRRDEAQSHLESIQRFFADISIPTTAEIEAQQKVLIARRNAQVTELIRIRQEVRANPLYTETLREDILKLEETVGNIRHELYHLYQTRKSFDTLENQLLADYDKSDRVGSSYDILSSFEFEQCPRCLQAVSEEMKDREVEGQCSLCGRNLPQEANTVDDIERYRRQIDNQLAEIDELRNSYNVRIDVQEQNLKLYVEQVSIKRVQLDDLLAEFVSPVIRNIEILSLEIADISRQIDILEQQRQWREEVNQLQRSLSHLDNQIEDISDTLREMEEQEKIAARQLSYFTTYMREFLSDLSPEPIERLQLHRRTYLPIINGYPYDSKSATERNLAIIGYFYAQLRYAIEYTTYFPKFLIIDTLRQDDLDRETYEKILQKFKALGEMYNEEFQLLLVIREPVASLVTSEILQFVNGEHLLHL